MTREQLTAIFKANDVHYDKGIEREETEGFVNDECEARAREMYGDISRMVMFGMQYGFSKCEDDIKDLTKLIASLIADTSRKPVNLAKTEAKRQQILKGATYLRRELNMDMLNQLMSNLNACIKVTDVICELRKDNERLCGKLSESKGILEEIKTTLESAADVTSQEAAEHQARIFEALMEWREDASRYTCISANVSNLKNALEEAKEWQKLSSAALRKKAKAGEDYYVYNADYDEIELILGSENFMERTEGLRDHLDAFKQQTEQLYSVSALEDKKRELTEKYNADKAELEQRLSISKGEYNSLVYQYQNGKIDPIEADKRMTKLEDEQDYLETQIQNAREDFNYEIEGVEIDLETAKSAAGVRERVASQFEKIAGKIESYKNTDAAMFAMLAKELDFKGIYDTLSGRLDDAEVSAVYAKVDAVIAEIGRDLENHRKNFNSLDRIAQKDRDRMKGQERILREQEQARRAKLRGERSSLSEGGKTPSSEEEAKLRMARRMARLSGANVNPDGEGEGNPNAGGLRNEDK